eukprot:gene4157-6509_t
MEFKFELEQPRKTWTVPWIYGVLQTCIHNILLDVRCGIELATLLRRACDENDWTTDAPHRLCHEQRLTAIVYITSTRSTNTVATDDLKSYFQL